MTELEEMAKKASAKAPEESSNILDLDALAPEPRIIRLGGEEIDVAQIPTRPLLQIVRFYDQQRAGKMSTEKSLDEILGIFGGLCEKKNPKITKDFLLDHLPMENLMAFIDFIIKPITANVDLELDAEGNPRAAE